MGKFTSMLILGAVLLTSWATYTEGLSCYTCKHTELGHIIGYSEDASCKWGAKPDDRRLQNCESTLNANEFDFVCSETRVNGAYNDKSEGVKRFVGTIRGCAARIITQQQNTTGENEEIHEECKQGKLNNVFRSFTNPTGKEYLQGINAIFEDSSNVKFCACDTNACYNQQQNVPEAGSDIGGTSGLKSTVQVILSVLLLQKIFL